MHSTNPIAHLLQVIEKHVEAIEVDLRARGEASPSWSLETPPVVGMGSKAIQESQIAIVEAVEELVALILGPVPWLVNKATDAVSVPSDLSSCPFPTLACYIVYLLFRGSLVCKRFQNVNFPPFHIWPGEPGNLNGHVPSASNTMILAIRPEYCNI